MCVHFNNYKKHVNLCVGKFIILCGKVSVMCAIYKQASEAYMYGPFSETFPANFWVSE